MANAKVDIEQMLVNFNDAKKMLTKLLKTQFVEDFKEDGEFYEKNLLPGKDAADVKKHVIAVVKFFNDVNELVAQATLNVNKIVAPLTALITEFEQMKNESEKLVDFKKIGSNEELRSGVVQETELLIEKCTAYDKKHEVH